MGWMSERPLFARADKNVSPGPKAKAGDARRPPVAITGAAATGVPKPSPSLGVMGGRNNSSGLAGGSLGSRSVSGGGGSGVAEPPAANKPPPLPANKLPLSQAQAQILGLVAAGKEGKARAKTLVTAVKDR